MLKIQLLANSEYKHLGNLEIKFNNLPVINF